MGKVRLMTRRSGQTAAALPLEVGVLVRRDAIVCR